MPVPAGITSEELSHILAEQGAELVSMLTLVNIEGLAGVNVHKKENPSTTSISKKAEANLSQKS